MANGQNPPRDLHYVPQLLLRRFVGADGTLWVYDLEKEKVYPARPETAGFVRDLYSRTGADGAPDHAHVEKLLSERVDGPGDASIRRLLQHETLGSDWNDFLIFVAAQLQRTPAFFDRMSTMMQPSAQEMLERMARHDPRFREGVRQSALARGESEEEIEKMLQAAGSGGFRVKPTKDFVISMSLAMIYGIVEDLRQMEWQIATLDETDPDFVVGDHPVLPVVPKGEPVGLRHPEIDLKLPLSTRVAAIANWDLKTAYAKFRPVAADQINEETMRYTKRFLFASYRSEELLMKAKRLHGTGPKVYVRRVKTETGLAIVHEYR